MNNISLDCENLAWETSSNLLPCIIQDHRTLQILMLGYMNPESLSATLASGLVTFFSRSKQRLWVKGETSGNSLRVQEVHADCDRDALLILAEPAGPTCHRGTTSCFKLGSDSGV